MESILSHDSLVPRMVICSCSVDLQVGLIRRRTKVEATKLCIAAREPVRCADGEISFNPASNEAEVIATSVKFSD